MRQSLYEFQNMCYVFSPGRIRAFSGAGEEKERNAISGVQDRGGDGGEFFYLNRP
jgi:hypothetical protein